MPTKIRLQRRGKKGMPFYHIVIADGRAPRDGKYIEKIGSYNPLTKPAEILIDIDKSISWLQNGAQPTDTVKAILSYKGVMYKYHLLKGVKKGVLTEDQVEAKLQAWLDEKEAKINTLKKEHELSVKDKQKKGIEAEVKVNDAKAASIAKKLAKEKEKAEKAVEAEAAVVETQPEAEIQPVAEVETEIEAQIVAEPEAKVEAQVSAEPQAEAEVEVEAQVSAEPKAEAEEQAEEPKA